MADFFVSLERAISQLAKSKDMAAAPSATEQSRQSGVRKNSQEKQSGVRKK